MSEWSPAGGEGGLVEVRGREGSEIAVIWGPTAGAMDTHRLLLSALLADKLQLVVDAHHLVEHVFVVVSLRMSRVAWRRVST
jgi:hypothetical protein